MKPNPTASPLEEIVALALNEQGYLFQHKLANVFESKNQNGTYPHNWYIEAEEVPVSVLDARETRIDLILRYGPQGKSPWRIVIESKRSSRDFKRWVFFGQTDRHPGPGRNKYYFERADLSQGWNQSEQPNPPMTHRLDSRAADSECEVYDFGVEAKIERPTAGKPASATSAIEDALYQVTLGQAGLAAHLRRTRELYFRLIPVVVTTAELFDAQFQNEQVSLDRGMIEAAHLKLNPRNWLAVNYRVSDVICRASQFSTNLANDIAAHLVLWQVRTVFVVQATQVQSFLVWLGKEFPERLQNT
jgi:hypothetical protein